MIFQLALSSQDCLEVVPLLATAIPEAPCLPAQHLCHPAGLACTAPAQCPCAPSGTSSCSGSLQPLPSSFTDPIACCWIKAGMTLN